MTQLTPYPGASRSAPFITRTLPKKGLTRLIIPLELLWMFGFAFFWFFRVDAFPLICLGMIVWMGGSIAIIFALALLNKALIDMRVGAPVVRVNRPELVRGDDLRVVLEQPIKTRTAIKQAAIRLVRYEWVRYTSGTDTVTEEHEEIIDEVTLDETVFNAGDTLRLKARFFIPSDAMHNFSASNNHVQWMLVVDVTIKAWPDFYERYDLQLSHLMTGSNT